MRFTRAMALLASGSTLAVLAGLTAGPAAAATSITIDQGESITISVPGVAGASPATIAWGDGSTSRVRTKCRATTARRHPSACTAKGRHVYSAAGEFTVTSTRKGRSTVIGVVTVNHVSESSTADVAGWQQDMLDQVNAVRAAAGVAPLRLCAPLERSAAAYSRAMADQGFFDHTGPDGSTTGTRVRAQGYEWTVVGENIAYGQLTVAQVVAAWRNSPGHYTNMISPDFTDVGFGKATNPANAQSPLWTQDLAAGGTC